MVYGLWTILRHFLNSVSLHNLCVGEQWRPKLSDKMCLMIYFLLFEKAGNNAFHCEMHYIEKSLCLGEPSLLVFQGRCILPFHHQISISPLSLA